MLVRQLPKWSACRISPHRAASVAQVWQRQQHQVLDDRSQARRIQAATQMRRSGGEDVPPLEGTADRIQTILARRQLVGQRRPIPHDQIGSRSIIRTDVYPILPHQRHAAPTFPPRIDHTQEDGAGGEERTGLPQREAARRTSPGGSWW
jgi:hypothetical protein